MVFWFQCFSAVAVVIVLKYVFQGVNVELNESDSHMQKPMELGDEIDSMTYHSEIAEFKSEQGTL
jgi:hypothetical protein